jgi:hypothetical protein
MTEKRGYLSSQAATAVINKKKIDRLTLKLHTAGRVSVSRRVCYQFWPCSGLLFDKTFGFANYLNFLIFFNSIYLTLNKPASIPNCQFLIDKIDSGLFKIDLGAAYVLILLSNQLKSDLIESAK